MTSKQKVVYELNHRCPEELDGISAGVPMVSVFYVDIPPCFPLAE